MLVGVYMWHQKPITALCAKQCKLKLFLCSS